jgi:hypothetical protein
MKYFLIFLLPLLGFGQDIEIYNHNRFGLKMLRPSKSIEKTERGFKVYRYNEYGMRDLRPTQFIKVKDENTLEVYNYNQYGVLGVSPSETINYEKVMFDNLNKDNGKSKR